MLSNFNLKQFFQQTRCFIYIAYTGNFALMIECALDTIESLFCTFKFYVLCQMFL